jgi:glucokinase
VNGLWISAELQPDGGWRTVVATRDHGPELLAAGMVVDLDQAAAIIRDLERVLSGSAGPTARRLANALTEAGAPASMVADALRGHYDEYVSSLEFPTVQLVDDLTAVGMAVFAKRVEDGEFDAVAFLAA